MNTSPQRIFWWGIGFLALGTIGIYVGNSVGVQLSLTSGQEIQTLYFWLISPGLRIIQSAAFPLGAALIAASVIIRNINPQSTPPPADESQHTTDPNSPA